MKYQKRETCRAGCGQRAMRESAFCEACKQVALARVVRDDRVKPWPEMPRLGYRPVLRYRA